MKKMSKTAWLVAGTVVGGISGFIYWKEIGCITGSCLLKSQWQTMIPYGMFMGYFITDLIHSFFNKQ